MSDTHDTERRDELDAKVAEKLRALRLARALPAPGGDEPGDEELLRYLDGSAIGRERERLEVRIAESAYASSRVAVVVEALRECGYPLPAPSPVGRRVARYVFRLAGSALTFLRGSDLPAALAPALAVRGAEVEREPSFFEFTHDFGAASARLQIERVEGRGFELGLTLTAGERPVDGARVTLRRVGGDEPGGKGPGGKVIDSQSTEDGACSFAGLPAAHYELDVKRGAEALGTVHVDVLSS